MRRWVIATVVLFALAGSGSVAYAEGGFDDAGYNRTARIFVGTGWSWCMDKVGDQAWCETYLGDYANDRLVMKWNAEWDRGNAEGWDDPNGYDAWLMNEWNGMGRGGSGSVWQYRYVWVGNCVADPALVPSGGSCIWGAFAVISDQGKDPAYGPGHTVFARVSPAGYGAYR